LPLRTLTALAAVVITLAAAAPAGAYGPLPLGPAGLSQTSSAEALAPGVRHVRIVRGAPDTRDAWTVDVLVTRSRAEAAAAAADIAAKSYDAGLRTPRRLPPVRYLVRSGSFATQPEATERAAALAAGGHPGGQVANTSEDGTSITGPWVVNVLEIDTGRFRGTIAPALATGIVRGRETVSSLSQRLGALAGINGAYFVISSADGTEGDLAGLAVERGPSSPRRSRGAPT
jgi:SPOR domain